MYVDNQAGLEGLIVDEYSQIHLHQVSWHFLSPECLL